MTFHAEEGAQLFVGHGRGGGSVCVEIAEEVLELADARKEAERTSLPRLRGILAISACGIPGCRTSSPRRDDRRKAFAAPR